MENCKACGFKKWLKTNPSEWAWAEGHLVRVWKCAKCGHKQAEQAPFLQDPPRILYVDIETSTLKTHAWGLNVPSKYINPAMLIAPAFVICWAASWLDETKVYSGAVTGKEAIKRNDRRCLGELWKLMDAADVVAGHNVKAFDNKKISTRFLVNNMPRPRTYRLLDTLTVARNKFSFPSNTLEAICAYLGFNPKADMHLTDWLAIVDRGDETTIEKMRRYNCGDVREGKKVLQTLLPWVDPFPGMPRGGYKVESEKWAGYVRSKNKPPPQMGMRTAAAESANAGGVSLSPEPQAPGGPAKSKIIIHRKAGKATRVGKAK